MELIKPREEFFDEYYEACKESHENNVTEWMPFELDNFNQWKKHILKAYYNYETGTDLPEGMPRTYTYWCVDNGKFIGEVQLRPFLNEEEAKKWGHIAYAIRYSRWKQGRGTELLRQILLKVQEFNIIDVYIVCRENNIGSIKVIEKNGGRFTNTVIDEDGILNNVYHIVMNSIES